MLKSGHSRSRRFNGWAARLLGLAGWCIHWALWMRLNFGPEQALADYFATAPSDWISIPAQFAAQLQQLEPERFLVHWLPLLWLSEAAMLIWLPAFIARGFADGPYSEKLQTWASTDELGELYWEGGLSSEVKSRLAEEGIDFLLSMSRAVTDDPNPTTPGWTLNVLCSKVDADPAARWVTLSIVEQTQQANGKIRKEYFPVVIHWLVEAASYAQLIKHLQHGPCQRDAATQAPPEELLPALAAMEAGDFEQTVVLAENLRDHPEPRLRTDALRLCALGLARQEKWNRAYDNYHALFACEPSVSNAMQLATTSVMDDRLERGQTWFEKASKLNAERQTMPWPELHTNFLSALAQKGEWAAGLPHVEWLRAMYQEMSSNDDRVTFMHGMPFLSVFFEKSLPFLRAHLGQSEVLAWYEKMHPHLDAEGQEKLTNWLERLRTA